MDFLVILVFDISTHLVTMAEGFDPKEFLKKEADEIAELFLTLKKNEVLALGKSLGLEVKISMRKLEIQNVVLEQLVEKNIVENGSIELPKAPSSELEIRRLEIQQEKEEKDRQYEIEEKEKDRQLAKEMKQMEMEMKQKEMEMKRMVVEAEEKARRIAADEKARQIDAEERAR